MALNLSYISDNTTICDKSELFWKSSEYIYFSSYYIVMPIYAIFGTLGHIAMLIALFQQAKLEQAYAYQIFLSINETLEILTFTLFSFSFLWGGVEGSGASWYITNYILMWFTAHVAIPLSEWMSVNSLLLSVSMSADRALSLGKPFIYRNIKHKLHQRLALYGSTFFSLISNIYNIFLFNVGRNDVQNEYTIEPSYIFLTTTLSTVLQFFCNTVRICGVITLVVCNILIVRMFRASMSQVANMTGEAGNSNEEKQKRANERTLILLTVCQSTFVGLSAFSEVTFYTAAYIIPYFNDCEAKLLAPILNAVLQLSTLGNTYGPMVISKHCRSMVWKAIPFLDKIKCNKDKSNVKVDNKNRVIVGPKEAW